MKDINPIKVVLVTLLVMAGVIIIVLLGTIGGARRHMMMDRDMGAQHMSMSDMMNQMSGNLENLSGDEFDKAFLSEMIAHHEGAVAMAKQVLIKSDKTELKTLAQAIISTQTSEIELMKKWQTDLFVAKDAAATDGTQPPAAADEKAPAKQ